MILGSTTCGVCQHFTSGGRDTIEFEKDLATGALRLAVRTAGQRGVESDLRAAMESRTVIDLAVSAVMGRNRCSRE